MKPHNKYNKQTKLNENDAIVAGDIAGGHMPLFSTLVKRKLPTQPKVIRYSDNTPKNIKKRKPLYMLQALRLSESLGADKGSDGFNISAVMSKLKGLENKESVDRRDIASFGLTDEKGKIIRVSVPKDQADNFEKELQQIMRYQERKQDQLDVADILYELKDHYQIIDVQWPSSEENEEGEYSKLRLKGGSDTEDEFDDMEDDLDNQALDDIEKKGSKEDALSSEPEQNDNVTDLLLQVIDMLKADADAKKADAQAREAEAKTRQAMAARDQARARVSQEEQYLEMDSYNKAKKAKDQEAKRLAQLARWKHDVKHQKLTPKAEEPEYDIIPGEEDEELDVNYMSTAQLKRSLAKKGESLRGPVSPSDIAKFILNKTKG